MNILALETSFGACSAAVLRGDGASFSAYREMARGHAEALMPMVDEVVRAAGIGFPEIGRIAATTGPGSFTGVRIAVAAARGLALATGAELVGMSSLAVMAHDLRRRGAWPDPSAPIAIARDARRESIYLGVYAEDGRTLAEPRLVRLDMALKELPELRFAAGDGAALLAEAASECTRRITVLLPGLEPSAMSLAELALGAPPQASISPLYFRPPDAKLPAGRAPAAGAG